MKALAKLLYWKLAVPDAIHVLPVPRVHVASGPFRGMQYLRTSHESVLSAKILGTYEKELHPWIEAAMQMPFERIVNIGAGEGYYAVGFARDAKTDQHIIAFERDEYGRQLMHELAMRNGVSNLTIRGECTIGDLDAVLTGSRKTLVICDVEGFEMELMDPARVNGLTKACILMELHDYLRAGVSRVIHERFAASHHIQQITSASRQWSDFPAQQSLAARLPHSVALRAMDEGRDTEMSWLSMQPFL
jgi:hypothetical protein